MSEPAIIDANEDAVGAETAAETIARLQARLDRLKNNMLSNSSRSRIIVGAVAMEEALRNRPFAEALLKALDRGRERLVDLKTVAPFVAEVEELWGLQDR